MQNLDMREVLRNPKAWRPTKLGNWCTRHFGIFATVYCFDDMYSFFWVDRDGNQYFSEYKSREILNAVDELAKLYERERRKMQKR